VYEKGDDSEMLVNRINDLHYRCETCTIGRYVSVSDNIGD